MKTWQITEFQYKMSQPRTRSQGPPDTKNSEGAEESVVSSPSSAERRMS